MISWASARPESLSRPLPHIQKRMSNTLIALMSPPILASSRNAIRWLTPESWGSRSSEALPLKPATVRPHRRGDSALWL